jgi:hypothetical protein
MFRLALPSSLEVQWPLLARLDQPLEDVCQRNCGTDCTLLVKQGFAGWPGRYVCLSQRSASIVADHYDRVL